MMETKIRHSFDSFDVSADRNGSQLKIGNSMECRRMRVYMRLYKKIYKAQAHAGMDTAIDLLSHYVNPATAVRTISLILSVCSAGLAIAKDAPKSVKAMCIATAVTTVAAEFVGCFTNPFQELPQLFAALFHKEELLAPEPQPEPRPLVDVDAPDAPVQASPAIKLDPGISTLAAELGEEPLVPPCAAVPLTEDEKRAINKSIHGGVLVDEHLSNLPLEERVQHFHAHDDIEDHASDDAGPTRQQIYREFQARRAVLMMDAINKRMDAPDNYIWVGLTRWAVEKAALDWFPLNENADPFQEEIYIRDRRLADPMNDRIAIRSLIEWLDDLDEDEEEPVAVAHAATTLDIPKIINTAIFGLSMVTLASMKVGGYSISDLTKLIAAKNTLTTEFNTIRDFAYMVARDWFGIELSASAQFATSITGLLERGDEFTKLSMQDYYTGDHFKELGAWVKDVETFITTTRTVKDINQSPGYNMLMALYTKCRETFESVRRMKGKDGYRQEPVVVHLAGAPGVGKTWLETYLREILSKELSISEAPYNVNKNQNGGFYPTYCGEKFMVVDEFMGAVDDKMVEDLNGLASTAPFKLEGASLPEKDQWAAFDFIILMSNNFRPKQHKLTPEAEKAFYSRLKTTLVRFPGQDPENPRSLAGRLPDCSHLRLDSLSYEHNGSEFVLDKATAKSLHEFVQELKAQWNENHRAYIARANGVRAAYAAPTKLIPVADPIDAQAVAHSAAGAPFVVHLCGDPGSGKTMFTDRVMADLAKMYGLPIVHVKDLSEVYDEALCVLDDVVTQDNIVDYMRFVDSLGPSSIVWISSNIPVEPRWRMDRRTLPFIPWGVPMPTHMFEVGVETKTHSGFVRRIGLSGRVQSYDSAPVYVSRQESHGIFIKFRKEGLIRKYDIYSDVGVQQIQLKDAADIIHAARLKHMDESGDLVIIENSRPIIQGDVVLHANTIQELNEVTATATVLSTKFLTNVNPNFRISGRVFSVAGAARDVTQWVQPEPIVDPHSFRRVAIHYANVVRASGNSLEVSIRAGPLSAVFTGNVLHLDGITDGVSAWDAFDMDGTISVVYTDGLVIRAPADEWLALEKGGLNGSLRAFPAHRLTAATSYLSSTLGTQEDPLARYRIKAVKTEAAAIRDQYIYLVAGQVLKAIKDNPVLFALVTVLTVSAIGYGIYRLLRNDDVEDYSDELKSLEKKAKKGTISKAEIEMGRRIQSNAIVDKNVDMIVKFPTKYPALFALMDGEEESHAKLRNRKSGKRNWKGKTADDYKGNLEGLTRWTKRNWKGKTADDYKGNLEGLTRWTKRNESDPRKRRDYITHIDEFETHGRDAHDYIQHCRKHDTPARWSEYHLYTTGKHAHSVTTVDHGANTPLSQMIATFDNCSVIVCRSIAAGSTRVFGQMVGKDLVLAPAHIAEREGASLTIIADADGVPRNYTASVKKIARVYELAVIKITDPSWKASKSILHRIAGYEDDRPAKGVVLRPQTKGRPQMAIATDLRVTRIPFLTDSHGIEIEYRQIAYTASVCSTAGTLGLQEGDCGSLLIAPDPFRCEKVVVGMYIGKLGELAYFVTLNSAIVSALVSEAEAAVVTTVLTEEIGGRVVHYDIETQHLVKRAPNHVPRVDFASELNGIGGIIGYTIGDTGATRDGEKPCRVTTGLDPDTLPCGKRPCPVRVDQVPKPDSLKPIPGGRLKGTRDLIYANASGQFVDRKSVDWRYYEHVIPHIMDRLPRDCFNFRRKTIMEVLNGGVAGDPYYSERGSVNIYTSPGYFYETKFGMTDKTRFFRGHEEHGVWVVDRPLVIDTSRPEGKTLLTRFSTIASLAEKGETLCTLAKTFQKRELIKDEKADVGKIRTCESMDFALNMWFASMGADFYERRQHHRINQHLVIGADFSREFTWMRHCLEDKNPHEVMAVDVPAWDRNTHANVIKAAIELLVRAALRSPNFTNKETARNEFKAMEMYYTRPISIMRDCVYWLMGRMSSGIMFTAQFNSDGHLAMRMAGAAVIYEREKGVLPPVDVYSEYCAEFLYGDDMICAVKPEGYWLLGPQRQKEIYAMAGYNATNDAKTGDPEATPYEQASFCSRFFIKDGQFCLAAIKKPTILSLLHWASDYDVETIESNYRAALEEAIPWGPEFFNEVREVVLQMKEKLGMRLLVYDYEAGKHFYTLSKRQELDGCLESIMTARAHGAVDLGAQPNDAKIVLNHSQQPLVSTVDSIAITGLERQENLNLSIKMEPTHLELEDSVRAGYDTAPYAKILKIAGCHMHRAAWIAEKRAKDKRDPHNSVSIWLEGYIRYGNRQCCEDEDCFCWALRGSCLKCGDNHCGYGPYITPIDLEEMDKIHEDQEGVIAVSSYGTVVGFLHRDDDGTVWYVDNRTKRPEIVNYDGPMIEEAVMAFMAEQMGATSDELPFVRFQPMRSRFKPELVVKDAKSQLDDKAGPPDDPQPHQYRQEVLALRRYDAGEISYAELCSLLGILKPVAHSGVVPTMPTDTGDVGNGSNYVDPIPSEGPIVDTQFMLPTTGLPIELVQMVGSQLSSIEVATNVFAPDSTSTKRITSSAGRGTIIYVDPYLSTKGWSKAMKDNARLNYYAAGSCQRRHEFHGPTTNGGSIMYVWLPFTPTGNTLDMTEIGQYPYQIIPMGGGHAIEYGLADSTDTPRVRKMSEFFDGNFDPKTMPCICAVVEMPINNGYNPGDRNEIVIDFVTKMRFGEGWYMARCVPGGIDNKPSDAFVGKELKEILNSYNIRLATGTTEFWPPSAWPVSELPDAPIEGFTLPAVQNYVQQPSSTPNPSGTDEDTHTQWGYTKFPGDGNTGGYIWITQRALCTGTGLQAPTWGINSQYIENIAQSRAADTDCNCVTHYEPTPTGDFNVTYRTASTSTAIPMRIHRADIMTNEYGTWVVWVWSSAPIGNNITGLDTVTVPGNVAAVAKAKFLGSASVHQMNLAQPRAAGLIPYKSAFFKHYCPPIKGTTSLPTMAPEGYNFSRKNDMKMFKFVSPGSTANTFTIVCVQGQIMIHFDSQKISDDFLDDWKCTSVSTYSPSGAVEVSNFAATSYAMATVTRGNHNIILFGGGAGFSKEIAPAFLPTTSRYAKELLEERFAREFGVDPRDVGQLRGPLKTMDELLRFIEDPEDRAILAAMFLDKSSTLVPAATAHSATGIVLANALESTGSGLGYLFTSKREQKLWKERAQVTAELTKEIDKARAYNQHQHQIAMMNQKNALAAAQLNAGMNHVNTSTAGWTYADNPTRTIGTTMHRDAGAQAGKPPRLNPITDMKKKTFSTASTYDPMDDYEFANQRPRTVSTASTTVSEANLRAERAVRAADFEKTVKERDEHQKAAATRKAAQAAEAEREWNEKRANSVAQRNAEKMRQKMEAPIVTHTFDPPTTKPTPKKVPAAKPEPAMTEAQVHKEPTPRPSTASSVAWDDFEYLDPNDMPNSIVFTNSKGKNVLV
ncbi:hypothetical protein [Changjiang picorna-like virus 16]|uniref:hypothetical protein n=1 Tax=Changjiang picorna-like virus 16 TaxID=1922789 RepID=UPI00090998B8|nr:hypothetical protein [Changjiang picorna-like virus 16]APG78985.1 hypothetical protein [Changjiang picorna-like virus 16]